MSEYNHIPNKSIGSFKYSKNTKEYQGEGGNNKYQGEEGKGYSPNKKACNNKFLKNDSHRRNIRSNRKKSYDGKKRNLLGNAPQNARVLTNAREKR